MSGLMMITVEIITRVWLLLMTIVLTKDMKMFDRCFHSILAVGTLPSYKFGQQANLLKFNPSNSHPDAL